jgi:microcystin degradation protein MlrC
VTPDRRRIVLAGFFHETHTFVPGVTPLADFVIWRGDSLLTRRGDGSMVDGFLEVADRENWDVVSLVDYSALPSGVIDHAVFEQLWSELNAGLGDALASGPVDGIWLALHGAAVTTACVDPEGELLARLRAIPGVAALPIYGVFDLHATFTEAMAKHATGLVGYRENPHIDARDSAVRSADLMARGFREGVQPHMAARIAPIIWAPTGTGTADSPMRDLEQAARAIEQREPSVWAVNVVAGFAFSDVPDAGVAFSLIGTAEATAREGAILQSLVDMAVSLRERGLLDEWRLEDALAEADTVMGGPAIIVEPADNIGGGAPGDCTAVLRGMLRHGTKNAAVVIADPESVAALEDAKPGERRRLAIGGKQSPLDEGPVEIEAVFLRRSDGHFTLEDRNSHLAASQGVNFDMGPSAVVEIEGRITVLLTSRKTPPFDLAQLRSQGIVPETLSVIGVKAAVAHRRAYDRIAARSFTVTTMGPCTSDLTKLDYRRLRRPIFPLDAIPASAPAPGETSGGA